MVIGGDKVFYFGDGVEVLEKIGEDWNGGSVHTYDRPLWIIFLE